MENHTPKQQLASPEGLAWVRGLMETSPDLSRSGLAKAACARLNWMDILGRPKEMACRKALVQLERQGAIVLPAARRAKPAPRLAQTPPAVWPEVTAALSELGTVELKPVRGRTDESRTWNALMDAHHPLRSGPLCGAQIRYLIISKKRGVLGGLAVSACAWRLSARDEWLGWDDAMRDANLSGIVCNSRFLILPTVRVKHLASHVLAQLARRIAGDWRERYGLSPWLMETYVDAARSGTSYRAANWIEAGMTAGRGRQDSAHKTRLTQKRVFLYPLCQKTLRSLRPERAARGSGEGWLRREFGGARLGDPRLERRLLELGRDFFAATLVWSRSASTAPGPWPISRKLAARRPEPWPLTASSTTRRSPWTPCLNRTGKPRLTVCAVNRWRWLPRTVPASITPRTAPWKASARSGPGSTDRRG